MFPGSNAASAPARPGCRAGGAAVAGWQTGPVPTTGGTGPPTPPVVGAAPVTGRGRQRGLPCPQRQGAGRRAGRCSRRRGRAGVRGGGRGGQHPGGEDAADRQCGDPGQCDTGSHPAITRTSTSQRPSSAPRTLRTIDTGLCPITAPPRTRACCADTPTHASVALVGPCGRSAAVAGPQIVLTPAAWVRAQVGFVHRAGLVVGPPGGGHPRRRVASGWCSPERRRGRSTRPRGTPRPPPAGWRNPTGRRSAEAGRALRPALGRAQRVAGRGRAGRGLGRGGGRSAGTRWTASHGDRGGVDRRRCGGDAVLGGRGQVLPGTSTRRRAPRRRRSPRSGRHGRGSDKGSGHIVIPVYRSASLRPARVR